MAETAIKRIGFKVPWTYNVSAQAAQKPRILYKSVALSLDKSDIYRRFLGIFL